MDLGWNFFHWLYISYFFCNYYLAENQKKILLTVKSYYCFKYYVFKFFSDSFHNWFWPIQISLGISSTVTIPRCTFKSAIGRFDWFFSLWIYEPMSVRPSPRVKSPRNQKGCNPLLSPLIISTRLYTHNKHISKSPILILESIRYSLPKTIPKMRNPPLPKISTFSPNKHFYLDKHTFFWPHEIVLIMSGHIIWFTRYDILKSYRKVWGHLQTNFENHEE